MKLPKSYEWLGLEPAPRHLLKAVELYGVAETVGSKHNPVILGWAKEVDLEKVYVNDEIPWCGLFMATVMKRAGRPVVDNCLRALAWNNFGVAVDTPMLGDVLTFTRKGGGHVGLYVFETPTHFGVLGGNQGNQVSIVKIDRQRLSQARRPEYTNPPTNIRRIFFNPVDGTVSDNEA